MTCILLITLARNVSRLKDCNAVMTVIKHGYTVYDKIEVGALLTFKQAFMLGSCSRRLSWQFVLRS